MDYWDWAEFFERFGLDGVFHDVMGALDLQPDPNDPDNYIDVADMDEPPRGGYDMGQQPEWWENDDGVSPDLPDDWI